MTSTPVHEPEEHENPERTHLAKRVAPDQYTLTELLYEGATATLYQGVRHRDGWPVVIKALRAESPTPRDIERLRREFEIGQHINSPYVIKPYALERCGSQLLLITEDYGGVPLAHWLGVPLELGRFFDTAIRLAMALADIHAQGIVHKDLKPASILLHPQTGVVKLTDFGIAVTLTCVSTTPASSIPIAGSLAYLSPEQTGRMHRGIDQRSDLYALGVTFYEMLTGTLPFQAADPLEWVHCHIAREPTSPCQLRPMLPLPLANIVLKLLAKHADERYQSARGLQSDLERCQHEWKALGCIEPFPLGEHDSSAVLLIPQKLYGRDTQIVTLLRAFEQVVATGRPGCLLVSGYSGIGKSSLVQELYPRIIRERGFFISGKVDQQQRDIPYAVLAQAFQGLIQQILTQSNEQLQVWKEELQQALGVNGQLIVDLIPRLELLIGPQAPVPELPLSEAQHRFHTVFQKFVGVFAKSEHPLTLFLDDLQWLDLASLQLIAPLLTHAETGYLFLIGAYRDNEVSPSHPLWLTLDTIRKSNTTVQEIVLGPLSPAHLEQLVAATVHRSLKDTLPLSRLVYDKTAGNPFFALQFLTMLYQERLLVYDTHDAGWNWDVAGIRKKGFTGNVVDLMVGKLKRLAAATQEMLMLAACIGDTAEVRTLAVICDRSESQLHTVLWEAVNEGLLVRGDGAYTFLHDRVQEAAYALIPEAQRAALHLRIGRRLLSCLSAEETTAKVFDIVNQLNLATALITTQDERRRVAKLNLWAARKAKRATAYRAAIDYLSAGTKLLGNDAWEHPYPFVYSLFLERAECAFLSGAFDQAEQLFPVLLRRAQTRVDTAAVYRVKIDTHTTKGEDDKAIESALECLRLFGINMSPHPSMDEVQAAYQAVWSNLGTRRIEALIDLPLMTDPEMQAAMEILASLYAPAYHSDNNLFYLHLCHGVNLSLQHGNAAASTHAYGWFGIILGTEFRRPQEGYRFAKLAFDLMERHQLLAYKAKANFQMRIISYWTQPIDRTLEFSQAAFAAAVETGDVPVACFSCNHTVVTMLIHGDHLADVHQEAERGLDFVRRAGFRDVYDMIVGLERFVQTMRGRTRHFSTYDDDHFSEAQFESELARDRMPTLLCYYYVVKLMARFLAGDYEAALAAGNKARTLLWAALFSAQDHWFYFYYALTLAAICNSLTPEEQQEVLGTLAHHRQRLRASAEIYPPTFHHSYALVAAEVARLTGKELEAEHLYEEAIQSAREHGFVHNEAMGNELAARFYQTRGLARIAGLYLREARAGYARWGADGKVQQLDRLYTDLQQENSERRRAEDALRQAEQNYAVLVNSIDGIVWEADARTFQFSFISQKAERLLGYPVTRWRNEPNFWRDHVHPDDRGWTMAFCVNATAEKRDHEFEYRMLSADGRTVWLYDFVTVVLENDQVTKLRGVMVDITERKRAGALRAGQRQVLEMIATNAPLGEVLGSLMRLIESQSEGMLGSILLLDEDGKHLRHGAAPSLPKAYTKAIDGISIGPRVGSCGTAMYRGEPVIVTDILQDPLWADYRDLAAPYGLRACWSTPIFSPQGRVLGSFAMYYREVRSPSQTEMRLIDIAVYLAGIAIERKRAEEELRKYREHLEELVAERTAELAVAKAKAEEADRLKSAFLATMSHELRTPLNSILGFTGILLQGLAGPLHAEQTKQLQMVQQSGRHLLHLINEVLDLSKIEAGQMGIWQESFDMCQVIAKIIRALAPLAERKHLTLLTDVAPEVGRVTSDPRRVEQILLNLVHNAIKFTATGHGQVRIACWVSKERLLTSVTDTGIGVRSADLDKLFMPFRQLDSTLARQHEGSGLGLAICKKLAGLLGGEIRVESQWGVGSTFTLVLPHTALEASTPGEGP